VARTRRRRIRIRKTRGLARKVEERRRLRKKRKNACEKNRRSWTRRRKTGTEGLEGHVQQGKEGKVCISRFGSRDLNN